MSSTVQSFDMGSSAISAMSNEVEPESPWQLKRVSYFKLEFNASLNSATTCKDNEPLVNQFDKYDINNLCTLR